MNLAASGPFWKLCEVMLINFVLSGDNAIVIAMATLRLHKTQRKLAVVIGTAAAAILRFVFIFLVGRALEFPYLQALGGILLAYLAISLLYTQGTSETDAMRRTPKRLWAAVGMITFADLAMSLDNVVALAGIAAGNEIILIVGLVISIALIMFASTWMAAILARFRWLQILGAGVLAWTAGGMIGRDAGLSDLLTLSPVLPIVLATFLVFALYWVMRLFRMSE